MDRATWSLVTALTRQQAQRGQQVRVYHVRSHQFFFLVFKAKGSGEAPAGCGSGSSLPPPALVKVEKVDSTYTMELGHAAGGVSPPRMDLCSSVSKTSRQVSY